MEIIETTEEQIRHGTRVILVGALVNIFLSVFKFVVGIIGHSTVMVADAIHSLSDLITDAVVWFSLKISRKPRDEDHPYGHGRAETIGEAVVGFAVVLVGFGMLYKFLSVVYNQEIPEVESIAITGAILSILMKEWLFRYTRTWGAKIKSPSLVANAYQHRSDALSSVAALIGVGGALAGYPIMDPLGALVIAFLIMRDGWRILWEAVRNLMDTAVSESELEGIRRVIESTPGILDYHELRTRRVGTEVLVDVHVRVEPRISISEGHNLQENLRLTLLCKYPHIKEVLVHLDTEPDHVDRLYALDRNALENMARGIVRKVDEIQGMEDLMIHYLDHKITLDLSVKMGDEITIGQCRSIVQRLERELLKIPEIEEVNVRCNLTGNRRPLEQPAPSEKEG